MKPAAAAQLRSAPVDEATLIEGCRRQDRAAQAELYRTYRPHVMRIVHRVLGPQRDNIEDVVQDVFLAAFDGFAEIALHYRDEFPEIDAPQPSTARD